MTLILPNSDNDGLFDVFGQFREFKDEIVPTIVNSRMNQRDFELNHTVKFEADEDRSLVVDRLHYDPQAGGPLSNYDKVKQGLPEDYEAPKTEQVLVQMHDPRSNYTAQINIDTGIDTQGYPKERFVAGIYEPKPKSTEGFQDSFTRHHIDNEAADDLLKKNKIQLIPFNDFKAAIDFVLDFFFTKTFSHDL